MRITFSPTRTFEKLSDNELASLARLASDCPELLYEVFWEASERNLFAMLAPLREAFRRARLRELDDELSALDNLRKIDDEDAVIQDIQRVLNASLRNRIATAPSQPSNALITNPMHSSTPARIAAWQDTARQIRHATVSKTGAALLASAASYEQWAKESPLGMLCKTHPHPRWI